MSAAEKLRALDAQATPGPWQVEEASGHMRVPANVDAAFIAALRNALPAIIAVVEAAEESVEYDSDYADVNDPNPVAAALATLSQALEETP